MESEKDAVEKAVKTFQAFSGLGVSGIADKATIEKLKLIAK